MKAGGSVKLNRGIFDAEINEVINIALHFHVWNQLFCVFGWVVVVCCFLVLSFVSGRAIQKL